MEEHGPTHTELAYLAGFFDGEGCINERGLTVNNCCPFGLEKFKAAFPETTITKTYEAKGNARTCFRWYASGSNARKITRALLPYLQEKKAQAEIYLQLLDYPKQSETRKTMIGELKRLKRIDYNGYPGI